MTELETQLDYRFEDAALLTQALTHSSALGETPGIADDNQRLEFLGDAVLQLSITEVLFRRFPALPEGKLTVMRRQLVRTETLAQLAGRLDLGRHLILGKGEELNGGRAKPKLLADALESLFGAVYLDRDWHAATRVVLHIYAEHMEGLQPETIGGNPKGALQEKLQVDGSTPPDYRIESSAGPPHERTYTASVHWCGRELARGTGPSKKDAEIAAAAAALEAIEAKGALPSGAEEVDSAP
ncbi:MAG: ribonuclease III [Verrucomicrobiota bacterium]